MPSTTSTEPGARESGPAQFRSPALKIAVFYTVLGIVWIVIAGWAIPHMVHSESTAARLERFKGTLFVLFTAPLLGVVLHRLFKQIHESSMQLRDSEARIRLLADNLPGTYMFQYVPDASGVPRFTHVSAGVERVHGVSVAAVLQDAGALRSLVFEELRPALAAAEAVSAKNLTDFQMDVWTRHPSGVPHLVRLRSRPRQTGDGLILWDGFATDITEQKRAEEALLHSERNYREIFDATNEAIILHDAGSGRILDVNAAMLRQFGYASKEELLRKGAALSLASEPPYDLEAARQKMRLAVEQGPQTFEWLACARDGSRFWTEISLRSSQIGGEGRILAVVRDISRRKAQEWEIGRLTRLYATLSQVNQCIVRGQTRKELFDEICRVMVEFGRFRAVRIGETKSDGGQSGNSGHRMAGPDAHFIMPGWLGGCGVAAESRRTNARALCHHARDDARTACCRGVLDTAGVRACAAFPIRLRGAVYGSMTICSADEDFFHAEENRLLNEIADDISFALGRLAEQEERRRAEEALRESRVRLAAALASMNDAVFITDTAGRFIDFNDAFATYYKFKSKEECAKTLDEYPNMLDAFLADGSPAPMRQWAVPRALRGETGTNVEYSLRRKDTGEAWTGSYSFAPIRDPAGQVTGSVVVARDITAQKRAENALRESEEQFRAMFELASVGVGQADPRTGRWIRVNRKLSEITGYSPDEMLKLRIPELTHPDDRGRDWELFQQVVAGEIPSYHIEKRYIRKDGSLAWVNVNMTVIRNAAGNPVRTTATIEDITGRRMLEAQYQQAQKMEAIGQLAGGVAHDFNNILTSVLMQIELCKSETISEGAREGLLQIRSDANRAASLTRQLLLFSRRQVLQSRDLDLNEVVAHMARMLQRIIGEDVRLQLNLEPSQLITHADAGMLEQVLMNLSVNARDAMPEGGRLVIETSAVVVEDKKSRPHPDAKPGSYACLSVSDSGHGIPADVMPRIFEPFFTTKEPGKGTGLGLATVFGIVKQHQGWIAVESQPNHGTTFRVFLPASSADLTAVDAPAESPVPDGSETILIVEDEVILRRGLKTILSRHGYRVLDAGNGAEAQAIWREHQGVISLLLTDLVLPGGVNGQQLAAQFRSEKRQLRIIYATGYSAGIAGREMELHPGEKFMQKPFDSNDLLREIRSCLEH